MMHKQGIGLTDPLPEFCLKECLPWPVVYVYVHKDFFSVYAAKEHRSIYFK